jgi:DNA-binding transcriptional ArsR family regulator
MSAGAAELFKVLGVETRLKIIELLKKRDSIGAKELAKELGITVAAASQHLKILKHIGLVNSRREGYWIPYSINQKALEHCSDMMIRVCSCHHHHPRNVHASAPDWDVNSMNVEELEQYKAALEKKLTHINELLESLRRGS